jgi:hypothetical protein
MAQALMKELNRQQILNALPHAEFILIKDDGEYEMYANDAFIYFNNKRSIVEQLKNLIEFWNHNKNENSAGSTSYESINIKYGSNNFYRQKSE